MKKIVLMTLILVLIGCSSNPKKVYIYPKKVKFYIVDVNLTKIPTFKPTDINITNNQKIETSVSTFLKIKEITKRLRVHRAIYKKAFESLKRQILRYRKKNDKKSI